MAHFTLMKNINKVRILVRVLKKLRGQISKNSRGNTFKLTNMRCVNNNFKIMFLNVKL